LDAQEGADPYRYADVHTFAWYSPSVQAAVANELATGIGADRFPPNDPITREQMAVMMARALTFTGHVTGGEGERIVCRIVRGSRLHFYLGAIGGSSSIGSRHH
jgi:hypothetical protein